MDLLLQLLQFLLRLAFGLTLGMALVSPRQVTSGYFRNQLYVTLGLTVLSTLIAAGEGWIAAAWFAGVAAFFSYVGSVVWMYEKPILGRAMLVFVALLGLSAAWTSDPRLNEIAIHPLAVNSEASHAEPSLTTLVLRYADAPAAGAVLGFTLAAMLLGHWYLNTPTMQLAPLTRLIGWMAAALILRTVLCGVGLGLELGRGASFDGLQYAFLAIRWLSGLSASLLLAWMSWRTLKIPNTQSATGILYVAVITTFMGELAAQLLSAQTVYPL